LEYSVAVLTNNGSEILIFFMINLEELKIEETKFVIVHRRKAT